jgi:cbb3-type cytochrome oxidase subunit 3
LKGPGNFNWKVNLTNAQVSKDPQYVLRFVSHVKSDTPTYPKDSPMFGSRGFYIYPGPNAASSATPTPSSSPTPGPTASNTANGTGSSSAAPKKKKKSNAGAIAGGVLGGLVVLALILVGVLMLLRRQRKKKEDAAAYKGLSRDEERHDVKDQYAYEAPTPTAELPDQRHEATELPGSEPQPGALTGQYTPRKQQGSQPVEMGLKTPPVGR